MICEKNSCTGCYTCYNVCPTNAIYMENDTLNGAIYPKISEEKCIHCNLCKVRCPSLNTNKIPYKKTKECYAAIAIDKEIHNNSTSGGIAAILYNYILFTNGYAYGVELTSNGDANYIKISDSKKIDSIQGSKYVFSNIKSIYKSIKEDLNKEKNVLFIGLPCQVSGLYFFLNKEYSNLFTVDLICHGTPPSYFFKQDLEQNHLINKFDRMSFRDENKFSITFKSQNKIIYKKKSTENYYYFGFLNSLLYRDNCYNCLYAQKNRVGDITIGDFWGIENQTFPKNKGVSLVLINSNQGKKLFSAIQDKIIYTKEDIEIAYENNKQLLSPSKKPKEYDLFYATLKRKGYNKAIKRVYRPILIKLKIKDIFKKNLRRDQ